METKIFFTDVKVVNGEIKSVEKELEFVKWTPAYLVVKYPQNSVRAGENWAMGRVQVNKWLKEQTLRIEGDIPEWALIV